MWSEQAKEVAKALNVLGWTHIVRAKENCEESDADYIWLLQSKGDPIKDDDTLFIGWRPICGRTTMLNNVYDMHYDVTTDTYAEDELWEQVGRTPIKLEDIING